MKVYKDWEALSEVDMGSKQKAYLCENEQGEQRVLWWPDTLDYKLKDRFRKKIERIKGLANPYIATVYDIVHDEETHKDIAFAAHCPGEPIFLAAYGLNFLQKLRLLVEALRGLEFMHKNKLLHLNVKSDNVYAELVSLHSKVINWGAAIHFDEVKTLEQRIVGTPSNMSYEIVLGRTDDINASADIFSWAAVAYLVYTGNFPFPKRGDAKGDPERLKEIVENEKEPRPLQERISEFSAELDEMLCGLMRKNVNDRPFKTASELIRAIGKKWPKAVSKKIPPECDVIKAKLG